jgi:hypothetical protein
MLSPTIFFRNDDVNILDDELKNVMDVLVSEGVTVDMAVEPANVRPETVEWLKGYKKSYPDRVSIITHGYSHTEHIPGKGEFGGRSYADQRKDMKNGMEIMQKLFGEGFFPAFTCPKGGHDGTTIKCMDDSGYKVFSSYHNVFFKNTILYTVGRLLGCTHLFGKRISYHAEKIPHTNLRDISMSMSFISRYHSYDRCEFNSLDRLRNRFNIIRKTGQKIIGVTIHHRYHKNLDQISFIRDAIKLFKTHDCKFKTIERIFEDLQINDKR